MEGEGWSDPLGVRWSLSRLGPSAMRLATDAAPSAELSARLALIRERAWANRSPALRDLIVGYATLSAEVRLGASTTLTAHTLREATMTPDVGPSAGREVRLLVDYGRDADRADLEQRTGLSWANIVRLHQEGEYRVAFLGFTPGFAYLHGLHPALALPRRDAPKRVPKGGVAIADGRAGVYPATSPGGWWLLGTTPTELFDPWQAEPTALLPGDRLRFEALKGDAAVATEATSRAPAAPRHEGAIEVMHVWDGAASLQGRPRPAVGHLGMAQAGALDARAFHAASRLAGAPLSAPAIEFIIPVATLRALQPLTAALSGGGVRLLLDGKPQRLGRTFQWPQGVTLELQPDAKTPGSICVLAVGGGLTPATGAVGHPTLVGEGSSDLRAGVGGFGRTLRSGDVMALHGPPTAVDPAWAGQLRHPRSVTLRLYPGHAEEQAAFEGLLKTRLLLAARDRMGARLAGAAVYPAQPDLQSEGVPLGAVQLPADGRPMVLLADRGRTGGYALAGVVDPRDLPNLAQATPGSDVRFVRATP